MKNAGCALPALSRDGAPRLSAKTNCRPLPFPSGGSLLAWLQGRHLKTHRMPSPSDAERIPVPAMWVCIPPRSALAHLARLQCFPHPGDPSCLCPVAENFILIVLAWEFHISAPALSPHDPGFKGLLLRGLGSEVLIRPQGILHE